jgi:hypothetical protein
VRPSVAMLCLATLQSVGCIVMNQRWRSTRSSSSSSAASSPDLHAPHMP